MKKDRQYYVYLMTSYEGTTLYVGVTNDLEKRVIEHKNKLIKGFSSRYNVKKLVHYEFGGDINAAIEREKQIKSWSRRRKIELIERNNKDWRDLSEDWLDNRIESCQYALR